ncbi:hypothetical protein QW180_05410 [Vibrio sinaloensis]|nr:hypothetical protein [Vibrio sinaloensis]
MGPYLGAGIQLGTTNTLDLDAIFLSATIALPIKTHGMTKKIDTFRIGGQKMLGKSKVHGFQAEMGYTKYQGSKETAHSASQLTADGLSLGGAYIFQATDTIALRGGVDINMFAWGGELTYHLICPPNVNLGVVFNL